jgi:tetraprenyl-beta-curcumene synthase
LRALAAAAARQLGWASGAVAREARAWRDRAAAIPDAPIRSDALNALARKRGHTDGAALFCTIPPRRSPALLRLLVAYEIMWDYLDSVNERAATAGVANGRQLHLALLDALDSDRPLASYYRFHPWGDDGGYLCELVQACRRDCELLPSYGLVRLLVIREARRAEVLAINHVLEPRRRDADLRTWAADIAERPAEVTWFEASGAASASTTIHVLLALAADPQCRVEDASRAQRAYFPWISAATTMLDSFVDQIEDVANADHSYVGHYPNQQAAVRRIGRLIRRSLSEALALERGERHAVIVACMVAMYLSKDSARSPELRDWSARLATAGGSLTGILLPILRMWRIGYAQREC